MGNAGHLVHSRVSRTQKVEALLFKFGWDQYKLYKKHTGHVTPNMCFCIQWDPWVTSCISMRPGLKTSTQYFSCSGGPNAVSIKSLLGNVMLNICFHTRCVLGVTWCIPMCLGHEKRRHYFSCSGGTGTDSTKSPMGHVIPNLCFCIR
jgi:hypothetical protein